MSGAQYISIPKTVLSSIKNPRTQILYGQIATLCLNHGYCWASNRYFAESMGVSRITVQRSIVRLSASDLIRVEYNENNNLRKIYIIEAVDDLGGGIKNDTPHIKNDTPPISKMIPPHIKNDTPPNNIYNNKYNNKEKREDAVLKKPPSQKNIKLREDALKILGLFNETYKTYMKEYHGINARGYRPLDSTVKMIMARLAEGITVDDLERVISNKIMEWVHERKTAKWIRPQTLFNRTKCNIYVDQLAD